MYANKLKKVFKTWITLVLFPELNSEINEIGNFLRNKHFEFSKSLPSRINAYELSLLIHIHRIGTKLSSPRPVFQSSSDYPLT